MVQIHPITLPVSFVIVLGVVRFISDFYLLQEFWSAISSRLMHMKNEKRPEYINLNSSEMQKHELQDADSGSFFSVCYVAPFSADLSLSAVSSVHSFVLKERFKPD